MNHFRSIGTIAWPILLLPSAYIAAKKGVGLGSNLANIRFLRPHANQELRTRARYVYVYRRQALGRLRSGNETSRPAGRMDVRT